MLSIQASGSFKSKTLRALPSVLLVTEDIPLEASDWADMPLVVEKVLVRPI